LSTVWLLAGDRDARRMRSVRRFSLVARRVSCADHDRFVVRTSGLLIDTPTALIQPTLGAGKGDKTRHGLVLQIAAAFEGEQYR
jgi:hypothetical protein